MGFTASNDVTVHSTPHWGLCHDPGVWLSPPLDTHSFVVCLSRASTFCFSNLLNSFTNQDFVLLLFPQKRFHLDSKTTRKVLSNCLQPITTSDVNLYHTLQFHFLQSTKHNLKYLVDCVFNT